MLHIGSDNDLSSGRRQAIIWTNAGILFIQTLGTNFSEILSEIHAVSFNKMHLKMSSAKWRQFCLGHNVLRAITYSTTAPKGNRELDRYETTVTEKQAACYVLGYTIQVHNIHDDVIKWKHLPRYWPFVRGIHRSPVNSPHKGQWRRALMFSLICVWINGWVNNREAGDLRRHRGHYDANVMS